MNYQQPAEMLPAGEPLPDEQALIAAAGTLKSPLKFAPASASIHAYRARDGRAAYFVVRYADGEGNKDVRTASVRKGHLAWGGTTSQLAYPLYRRELDEGQSSVLVVEGEKTAEYAAQLPPFKDWWVTCPFGGAHPRAGTVWGVLKGRQVRILGDADLAGEEFAFAVLDAVTPLSDDVLAWEPRGVRRWLLGTLIDEEPPVGWDLADIPPRPQQLETCGACGEQVDLNWSEDARYDGAGELNCGCLIAPSSV